MEITHEERISRCALNRIFGFEPRIGDALIQAFGSASAVFSQDKGDLSQVLGAYSRARYLGQITESAFESAAIELESLDEEGRRFICKGEKGYPALLEECEDPPLGIYFDGGSDPEDTFGGQPAIAIVGTRDLTSYGEEWCSRIVAAFAKAPVKPLIVSGLALGVDITAHRAALEHGLQTVAVMATGIDSIYPSRNSLTGKQIAATRGCALITDYPPGTDAIRINFLRRNRIIAGICRSTILIESKVRGGGMMTARLAQSYGRDVFAIPGRLDDPASQGCNLLIRENVAEPVGDLAGLAERVGLGKTKSVSHDSFYSELEMTYRERMSDSEYEDTKRLATLIKKHRGISLEELCTALRWEFSKVSTLAAMLECDGFISIDLLQHCSAAPRKS